MKWIALALLSIPAVWFLTAVLYVLPVRTQVGIGLFALFVAFCVSGIAALSPSPKRHHDGGA